MAVVFTDVVDSTQVHSRLGDARARDLWVAHDRHGRELLREWRGREIGRTDGFLALFGSCDDALGFALGYHRALSNLQEQFAARVGVHWGVVALRPNSEADVAAGAVPYEVDGLALPIAARVMSAAIKRQTLFSADAASRLTPGALGGCQVRSQGYWRLKGLADPVELIAIGYEETNFTPPSEGTKAYRVTKVSGLWTPVASLPNNLGPELDHFVGREETLRVLADCLDGPARLVTLLGIGGIGKTRIAQRYARGWLGAYPGGAWFCDLSSARGINGIVHAVAQALDVPLGRSEPIQQLTNALAARGECLVILDNFEQVSTFADATLGKWLRALPMARFLVTSRELLGLAGEHAFMLEPMSSAEAQVLFVERMQTAGVATASTEAADDALVTLVELLDRLPLAIELAAARARVLPPADQVRRIGERFRLLVRRGGRRDRQATLRATLDWSWDLLSPAEQSALAQLSVFENGFTLNAAEAVIDLEFDTTSTWTADIVQSLVEKSLVRRVNDRRFDLLRTVQEYASERLAEANFPALERHWEYFAGIGEARAIDDRCVEIENMATACRRAASANAGADGDRISTLACAVRALANAWAAMRLIGPFSAALELATPLEAATDMAPADRALVERVLGGAAGLMGNAKKARVHYERGLTLAKSVRIRPLQAQLHCLLADLDLLDGHPQKAEEALSAAADVKGADEFASMTLDSGLGNLAMARSDPARAFACYGEALARAERLGERRWQGGLQGSMAAAAVSMGQPNVARQHFEKGLSIANALGDHQWAGNAYCNLGLLLHELGENEAARVELNHAVELARSTGHRRLEATTLCNLGLVTQALEGPEAALIVLENAVEVAQTLKSPRMEGQFLGYLAESLGQAGRPGDADDRLALAEALLCENGDDRDMTMLRCRQAVCAAQLGKTTLAGVCLDEAQRRAGTSAVEPDLELKRALLHAQTVVNRRC